MTSHPNILFLCVANSARSQMAEGLAKSIFRNQATIQSAGSVPSQVNPFAILAMDELGIDIRHHKSTSANDVDPKAVDLVITLCAEEVCPVFLSQAHKIHWPLKDPDRKNEALSDDERLAFFRIARDDIKRRIETLFESYLIKG